MLNKLRERRDNESGFTLIELLVVVLIIGILAAIALPSFLGQQAKGQDAAAKSDVRNAVSQMESCYVDNQSYSPCTTATLADAGLTSTVKSAGADGYEINAISKSGNTFIAKKTNGGAVARTCTSPNTKGGCIGLSW